MEDPQAPTLIWPRVSADCKRSNLAFRAIWLAGRTLPGDLSVCKGLSAGDQYTAPRDALKYRRKKTRWLAIFQMSCVLHVRTRFPPDWGHGRIPSVSLCIIAILRPPGPCASHRTTLPIHQKCHHATVCSRQNKHNSLWGRTGGCSLYLCQETQRVSINVMRLFPRSVALPPENVIINKL